MHKKGDLPGRGPPGASVITNSAPPSNGGVRHERTDADHRQDPGGFRSAALATNRPNESFNVTVAPSRSSASGGVSTSSPKCGGKAACALSSVALAITPLAPIVRLRGGAARKDEVRGATKVRRLC